MISRTGWTLEIASSGSRRRNAADNSPMTAVDGRSRSDDEIDFAVEADDRAAHAVRHGLHQRLVRLQDDLAVERALLDVADDADDGHPGLRRALVAPLQLASDRIAVRPEPARQHLADDDHPLGAGHVVIVGEEPPGPERNAKRLEVAADGPRVRDGAVRASAARRNPA